MFATATLILLVGKSPEKKTSTISLDILTNAVNLSAISGTLNFNGYVPAGATIAINERKVGDSQFDPIVSGITAKDGIVWSWNDAIAGTGYEIQGYLIYNGNTISQSKTYVITAPAYNEVMRINSSAVGGPTITSISGIINHNGIIPANSTYSIAQRKNGTAQQFAVVVSGIPVADSAVWIWNQSVGGVVYDFQAYLKDSIGNTIAMLQVLTVAAPAVNEILTINAQIQPPVPPATSLNDSCTGKNQNGLWQVEISYNINTVISNALQYWLTIGTSPQGNQIVSNIITPSSPKQSQSFTTGYVFLRSSNILCTMGLYNLCSM